MLSKSGYHTVPTNSVLPIPKKYFFAVDMGGQFYLIHAAVYITYVPPEGRYTSLFCQIDCHLVGMVIPFSSPMKHKLYLPHLCK